MERPAPINNNNTQKDGVVKRKISKKLVYLFILFDTLIFAGIILFFLIIPREEIKRLDKGFVSLEVTKIEKQTNRYRVAYSVVEKKPTRWVNLKDMNYIAIHAIVISEDWAFYNHSGYDFKQIKEAAQEVIEGERTRGASTISQQLVKNIFLSPDKELSRKIKELIISIYMERNISKEKILETYLNVIEFGPGIYGIKAASQYYFKKYPDELNAREGAFLAMLLPSPRKNSQSFRDKKLTTFAKGRINDILKKMSIAKYIRDDQVHELNNRLFSWEESERVARLRRKEEAMGLELKEGEGLAGEESRADLRVDESLELEDNSDFDRDAIIEDISEVDREFSAQ